MGRMILACLVVSHVRVYLCRGRRRRAPACRPGLLEGGSAAGAGGVEHAGVEDGGGEVDGA